MVPLCIYHFKKNISHLCWLSFLHFYHMFSLMINIINNMPLNGYTLCLTDSNFFTRLLYNDIY